MDGAEVSSSDIAVVVIGRNEGDRLAPSLRSVQAAGLPVVYVDSGSTDGSLSVATELGVRAISLTADRPFSAARGRNEGLSEAIRLWPSTAYVMFLDGDCILDPDFPGAARTTLEQTHDCAIVTGHLTERSPGASIYNRLCAIEWRSPAGRLDNMNALGGIMMVRVAAFQSVNGFNTDAIAGEEPDLGVRLVLAGHTIIKIDQPMATHEAGMTRFGQWWIRAVRGGHALAHRYARHGRTRLKDGRREMMSDLVWGLAVPAATLALLWPTRGVSLLLLGGYLLLYLRVRNHYLRRGLSADDARLASRFVVYSKFAHVVGIAKYVSNRLRADFRIIEYK